MNYYPIYLNLSKRPILIVGGGEVAHQKLAALLRCGADISLVAPQALPAIARMARSGKITWSKRAYRTADLKGKILVIAATDDTKLQKRIAKEARARRIWINVVDVPPLCDFIAPAVVQAGDIQIAISTGGAAPAFAKQLRKTLASIITPDQINLLRAVKMRRPDILKMPKEKRKVFWERAVKEWIHAD